MELDFLNVYSRYNQLHRYFMQPVSCLVNLIGPSKSPQVQQELQALINKGLKQHIIKPQQPHFYAKPCYKYNCIQFNQEMPKNPLLEQDDGFIKTSFFNNLVQNKPSISIYTFDLRFFFQEFDSEWNW